MSDTGIGTEKHLLLNCCCSRHRWARWLAGTMPTTSTCAAASITPHWPACMCQRALLPHPPTPPADPAYMANLCRDHGITILEVVPSLATQYVRDLAPLGQAGQMRIRRFLTGGEALSVALANSVYDALPNCEMVWNTYGPTEVTVQVQRCWARWRGTGRRCLADSC